MNLRVCSEFLIRVQVSEVRVAIISNNNTLDGDAVAFPISQLIETFFAWRRVK
jgi:hypothetical protein